MAETEEKGWRYATRRQVEKLEKRVKIVEDNQSQGQGGDNSCLIEAIVAGFAALTKAIRESKGDMTADEEQAVDERLDELNETLAEKKK